MAIQFKRGTTGNRTNYTPAAGELIVVDVDQVNPSLYVGDGSTAGGKLASASGGGGASDAFKTISVAGQDDIIADLSTDTLTLSAGANITLTTNATTAPFPLILSNSKKEEKMSGSSSYIPGNKTEDTQLNLAINLLNQLSISKDKS